MEQLLLYVKDSQAIQKWSQAVTKNSHFLFDLNKAFEFPTEHTLILVQLDAEPDTLHTLKSLLTQKYSVLLFSDIPEPTEALQWFHQGIKGYLNTHASAERIRQAVDTIRNGHVWLGQAVMNALILGATPQQDASRQEGWKERITEREEQTLLLVMEGKSNLEIAEKLHISERTVKAHMSKLLEKFSVKDRLALVLKIQNWQDE